MRIKLLLAAVLVAVGVGAVGVVILAPGGSSSQTQYLTSQATRTTVAQEAVATGTVAATATYGLAFGQPAALVLSSSSAGGGSSGTFIVETVTAAVGDKVKAGQVLASADTSSLEVDLIVAQANLAAANARLAADTGGPAEDVIASAQDSLTQARQSVANSATSRADAAAQNELSLEAAEQAVADAKAKLAADETGASGTSDQIASAQDQVASAERSLASARQNVLDVNAQNVQSLAAAQLSVQQANLQQQLDLNKTGTSAETLAADQRAVVSALANLESVQLKNDQSVRQAASQVTDAEIALASAQRNLASLQTPSSTAIEADRTALENAEANLEKLRLQLVASEHSAEQQIAQAQASLVAAQHSYESKVATATDETIASDRASVANAELLVSNAKQALERTRITSPVNGTVVDATLVAGVAAPSGYAFLVQTEEMQVTASFPEADLVSLKVGQTASVTLTATNEVVPGTVTQITPVAATSGASSVVSYAVVVSLSASTRSAPTSDARPAASGAPAGAAPAASASLTPSPAASPSGTSDPLANVFAGMTAEVAIITASSTNVVAVPAAALLGSSGNYRVRVLDASGAIQQVSVQVGLVTTSLAEITSGLDVGATVVTGTSSDRTGSSSTTTNRGGVVGIPGLDAGGPPAGGFPGGGR